MHRLAFRLAFSAMLFACSAPSASAAEAELSSGPDILRQTKEDFLASRFDALEARGEKFRTTQSRTPSGSWKLGFVYDAFDASAQLMDAPYDGGTFDLIDARLDAWLKAYPFSRQAHILKAELLVKRAWLARGDGFAETVKPEAWPVYRDFLIKAAKTVHDVRAFAADDPQWHALRLGLARDLGAPPEQVAGIEDEALEQAPTYYPIYKAMLHSKQPQWGGDWAAYDDAVDKIVARTAATEGQSYYARIYGDLAMSRFKGRLFERSLAKWPRMKQGLEDLVSRYPTDWNWNLYGAFACLANDLPTLRMALARLGDKTDASAWKEMVDVRTCVLSADAERRDAEDRAHYAKPQPIPTERLEQRRISNAARDDLAAGRFAKLDADRTSFLQNRETTPSGEWKLRFFSQGLVQPQYTRNAKDIRLDQPDFGAVEAQLTEWLKANPDSAGALIARAEVSLSKALFMLRDPRNGAERGGAGFGVLAEARQRLEEARAKAFDDPHWWAIRLEIELADRGGDETFFTLAEEALAKNSRYPAVRAAVLKRNWAPRKFTKAGFDKSVEFIVAMSPRELADRAYAEGYLWLGGVLFGVNLHEVAFIDWPRMKRGVEQVIAEYPADWNLNAYANLACDAKDKPVAAAQLARIGERIIDTRWREWRAPIACKAWVAAADQAAIP